MKWTQNRASNASSRVIAPAVRIAPTIRMRKAAGPSPTLKAEKSSPQLGQRGAKRVQPSNSVFELHLGHAPAAAAARGAGSLTASAVDRRAPAAPHVDRHEQEQPDDVDEMPVPGRRLEAEMLPWSKMSLAGAQQADDQKDRPDDDVEAVEAGRHEKGRAVNIAFEVERRLDVLIGLDAGEQQSEQDRQQQPQLQAVAVAVDQRMVRPGHGRSRA